MTETPNKDFDAVLLGRAGPLAAKFKEKGDFVEGTLIGKDTQQAAEWNKENPSDRSRLKFFPSGDPILELILVLQTDLKDPEVEEDTGKRRVFVSRYMQEALQRAVLDAGIKRSLPLGSHIRVEFIGTKDTGGGQPAKQYKVTVTPPADKLAVGAAQVAKPALTPELIALMKANGIALPV